MAEPGEFRIEQLETGDISSALWQGLVSLCDEAYDEATEGYLEDIGAGTHLFGWEGDRLVSHLMWVERSLETEGLALLRTAYVEMVATATVARNHGYATRLLEVMVPLLSDFDLAALSPAADRLYLKLGWAFWQGPLLHRLDGKLIADPDEEAMYLRLPRTPAGLDPTRPLSVEWRPGEVW